MIGFLSAVAADEPGITFQIIDLFVLSGLRRIAKMLLVMFGIGAEVVFLCALWIGDRKKKNLQYNICD